MVCLKTGTDSANLFCQADMQRSVSECALCESALSTVTNLCKLPFGNVLLHSETLQIDA